MGKRKQETAAGAERKRARTEAVRPIEDEEVLVLENATAAMLAAVPFDLTRIARKVVATLAPEPITAAAWASAGAALKRACPVLKQVVVEWTLEKPPFVWTMPAGVEVTQKKLAVGPLIWRGREGGLKQNLERAHGWFAVEKRKMADGSFAYHYIEGPTRRTPAKCAVRTLDFPPGGVLGDLSRLANLTAVRISEHTQLAPGVLPGGVQVLLVSGNASLLLGALKAAPASVFSVSLLLGEPGPAPFARLLSSELARLAGLSDLKLEAVSGELCRDRVVVPGRVETLASRNIEIVFAPGPVGLSEYMYTGVSVTRQPLGMKYHEWDRLVNLRTAYLLHGAGEWLMRATSIVSVSMQMHEAWLIPLMPSLRNFLDQGRDAGVYTLANMLTAASKARYPGLFDCGDPFRGFSPSSIPNALFVALVDAPRELVEPHLVGGLTIPRAAAVVRQVHLQWLPLRALAVERVVNTQQLPVVAAGIARLPAHLRGEIDQETQKLVRLAR